MVRLRRARRPRRLTTHRSARARVPTGLACAAQPPGRQHQKPAQPIHQTFLLPLERRPRHPLPQSWRCHRARQPQYLRGQALHGSRPRCRKRARPACSQRRRRSRLRPSPLCDRHRRSPAGFFADRAGPRDGDANEFAAKRRVPVDEQRFGSSVTALTTRRPPARSAAIAVSSNAGSLAPPPTKMASGEARPQCGGRGMLPRFRVPARRRPRRCGGCTPRGQRAFRSRSRASRVGEHPFDRDRTGAGADVPQQLAAARRQRRERYRADLAFGDLAVVLEKIVRKARSAGDDPRIRRSFDLDGERVEGIDGIEIVRGRRRGAKALARAAERFEYGEPRRAEARLRKQPAKPPARRRRKSMPVCGRQAANAGAPDRACGRVPRGAPFRQRPAEPCRRQAES